MDDGAVAGQAGRLDEFVVPFHGERLRLLVDERLDEGVEVARVEARGGRGEAARHVEVADDLDAVVVDHLAGLGDLDIAAALDREVDDHRARPHRLHHRAARPASAPAGPGISAVVMTMSCLAMWAATSSACFAWYSADISLA